MKLRPRPSFAFVSSVVLVLTCASACTKDQASAPADDQSAKPTADAKTPSEPAVELPDGAELLAAHVEASGGADKVERFESIHAKGTVGAPGQKLSGTMELWWKKGGKFYLEQFIEGVGQSRVGYDGETIWLDDPITGLRILEGEEAASYIQNSLMFPGHNWREHYAKAKTVGKQSTDDGEVWEVELESKKGVNVTLGLDANTKLIRYVESTQITRWGPCRSRSTARTTRRSRATKFSLNKRSSIKGLIELHENIETLEANVEIDESMFAFPNTREQVPADPNAQPPIEAPAPAPAP